MLSEDGFCVRNSGRPDIYAHGPGHISGPATPATGHLDEVLTAPAPARPAVPAAPPVPAAAAAPAAKPASPPATAPAPPAAATAPAAPAVTA